MFVTPVNGRNPARGLTIQCGRNRFLSNGAPRLSPLYFSVFLGADRIAMNGDFANKIGTYNLAVLCAYHKVPFYTVAPKTTIDPKCESGMQIPVEMRKDSEVRGVFGTFGDIRWAPEKAKVYNPAFDVTPVSLLTGIVVDNKVHTQKELLGGSLNSCF